MSWRRSIVLLMTTTTAAAAALAMGGLRAAGAAAPPAGCNGEVRQRAAPGPLGYAERHDAGDPRCEGLYQRDVAADNLPEVAPLSLLLKRRPFTPSDNTVITLAWPHVPAPVALCARQTADSILYRMDASKEPRQAPDQPSTACDEFRWHTGVLQSVQAHYPSTFELPNLRIVAQVNVPLTGALAEQFPQQVRGRALLLPLLVNAPAQRPAPREEPSAPGKPMAPNAPPNAQLPSSAPSAERTAEPSGEPAAEPTSRLALALSTNRELRDVTLRCTPLDGASGEPVVRTFNAVARGIFSVRDLELPADGSYWAAELTYRYRGDTQWEDDRTLFYLLTPTRKYVEWANAPDG